MRATLAIVGDKSKRQPDERRDCRLRFSVRLAVP